MESLMSQNYKISHESELWNHLEFRLVVIIKSRGEPKKMESCVEGGGKRKYGNDREGRDE